MVVSSRYHRSLRHTNCVPGQLYFCLHTDRGKRLKQGTSHSRTYNSSPSDPGVRKCVRRTSEGARSQVCLTFIQPGKAPTPHQHRNVRKPRFTKHAYSTGRNGLASHKQNGKADWPACCRWSRANLLVSTSHDTIHLVPQERGERGTLPLPWHSAQRQHNGTK